MYCQSYEHRVALSSSEKYFKVVVLQRWTTTVSYKLLRGQVVRLYQFDQSASSIPVSWTMWLAGLILEAAQSHGWEAGMGARGLCSKLMQTDSFISIYAFPFTIFRFSGIVVLYLRVNKRERRGYPLKKWREDWWGRRGTAGTVLAKKNGESLSRQLNQINKKADFVSYTN